MPFLGVVPQSFPHFATGPTLVEFDSFDLGYCEDRIQIDETPFWHEVKSDGYGGSEGPPCDVQYLGALVYVRCLLNRFKEDNIRALSTISLPDDESSTPGIMPQVGWYMRQDSGMKQLRLLSKEYILVFLKSVLRQGRKWTMGTRHQSFALVFECHVNNPCDAQLLTYEGETEEDQHDPCTTIVS